MNLEKPLNKAELVALVAESAGCTKSQTELIINTFLKIITQHLILGGAIKLVNFGHFWTDIRNSRSGRNPFNGDRIIIPTKRVVAFRAALPVKRDVAKNPVIPITKLM
jgi:DNA-binding protein HU-beta